MSHPYKMQAVDGRSEARPPGPAGGPGVSTGPLSGADDELLSINEVALIVRVPVATLRYWRYLGTGPHSFRVGRAVRYWRSEVEAWLREQSTAPRRGPGPA
jgi:predicted DNA-binding transcriptional regulator AlpA